MHDEIKGKHKNIRIMRCKKSREKKQWNEIKTVLNERTSSAK